MSTVAVRAAGLTKRYGGVRALDGLDLEVGVGEVHAFLGPNGAGKTTTIRILLGLLGKDGGEVSLLGADPWRDAVELHRRLAYVPGDVTLGRATGGEIIDLLGLAARRHQRQPPEGADRTVRPRHLQAGSRLLPGQPAEGRADRCASQRGRTAAAR